jgi:enoyl-CoA hydratase
MGGDAVRVRREDAVAVVELDHPPVNTMSDAVLEALAATAEALAGDSGVRAVVLVGRGEKAFASGADLNEFRAMLGDADAIVRHTTLTRRALGAIAALPQPVIAALQASAVGGGLELALACDLLVADPRARIGLPEVNLGLIPGAGGTQRLARRIGAARAFELIAFGRLLRAEEARELGLVAAVSEEGAALERALELARELADRPRHAVQAAKRAVLGGVDRDLEAGLDREQRLFRAVLETEDARRGVEAFLERRRPEFTHR